MSNKNTRDIFKTTEDAFAESEQALMADRTEMEYTIPFPTNIPNPNLVIIGTPESGKSLTLCELKEILRRRNTLKS